MYENAGGWHALPPPAADAHVLGIGLQLDQILHYTRLVQGGIYHITILESTRGSVL